MNHSEDLLIKEDCTVKTALEIIDKGTMRITVVVDEDNRVLGTLNDGDIRRALLKGYTLDMPIIDIYRKNPTICKISDSKETIIQKALKKKVYQIPIVDKENRLIEVEDLATLLIKKRKKNKVIIMAGGLGTRLQPLTNDTPKPLLKVGEKPILQTIIENFQNYGFKDIILSVNYKADMIKEYFEDGSRFGVKIEYLEEHKRLGTAGAISLIEKEIEEPFFVMNGDLLTNINFQHLLDFHNQGNAEATMCVREYDFQVPYGVIETKNETITSIIEKPVHKFFVNAGIYLLSPKTLEYIPKNEFYDMPTLFEKLIEEQKKTLSFPIHEYWLDIGRMEDFKRAQLEFSNI